MPPVSVTQSDPIPHEALSEVQSLLESGDLFRYTAPADQPAPVTRLENAFAKKLGVKYALALNSCSSAIFLALRTMDLPPDARVLIPSFTFAAVPSAVVHAGAQPVLAECTDQLRIDMADFEAKIASGIDAVIISHMRGHTSDMDAIKALCEAHDITLIEDAAHSLGTTWNDQNIGTLGKIGCFSFQSYKMLNGGEGGLFVTNDEDTIARAVVMSGAYEHNWQKHGLGINGFAELQNTLPLYNLRMNNLSAAVILPQLSQLDDRVSKGRENHDYLAEKIEASPYISVPSSLPGENRAPDSIQFTLEDCTTEDIAKFVEYAQATDVPISVFGQQKDNARAYWNWQFIADLPELPQTRTMLMKACDLRLPVRFTKVELDQIAAGILAAIAQVKG